MKTKTTQTVTALPRTALLAGYGGAAALRTGSTDVPPSDTTVGGSPTGPPEVQGEWQAGESASVGDYAPNSRAWQGGAGSSFSLKLRADGPYQYAGLLALDAGACQGKILSDEKGRATFEDGKMTFTPTEGAVRPSVWNGPVNPPLPPSAAGR
ncbi:hypothetical protein [Deinococcus hopiensis]|uniref:Uncharacterized protein n=1 Tax=Deinococcus hopiensis KR-140 TaxID=695939 RepID=A0A1W1UDZ3_9DEIO|nr:hypothetical protein [Deinococcus hopiensis]SMB79004.1 hypothetical protein SAMN00790413_05723 [Deinococcus hopiensis KR-140]